MKRERIAVLLRTLRVNQWIKNLVIFTAIIFSGKLFDLPTLLTTIYAFFIFCLLSSTSYVLNDIVDYPYDKKHPFKKFRPIASGQVTIPEGTFIVFTLTLISLIGTLLLFSNNISFFFLSLLFILLHFFYSLYLKKYPIIDIFTISFSFMIRAFAGEVATGFHIPIWLIFTIFFGSLFIATVKGSLVACYFMHLISEKKLIYFILIFTAVNLVVLAVLLISGYLDTQNGVKFVS